MAALPRGYVTENMTGRAAVDFSISPYRVVKIDGNKAVTPMVVAVSSLESGIIGITETQVGSGQPISVALRGQPYAFVSSACDALAMLTCSTSAGVCPAASGDLVMAQALEAGVTGQYLAVRLLEPFRLNEGP